MIEARVQAIDREGSRAFGIRLDVPAAWRATHTRPGQYVMLAPDAPLALASAPGAPVELLMGPDATARFSPAIGAPLLLSDAMGAGFDAGAARGREVLVFAVGSAASAARALIEAVARERAAFGRVRLYLGAHDAEAHAYRAHEPRWRAAGVEVSRALSRPWVHELFLADDPPAPDAEVFAAGHGAALASLRAAMAARGLDPARLRLNV